MFRLGLEYKFTDARQHQYRETEKFPWAHSELPVLKGKRGISDTLIIHFFLPHKHASFLAMLLVLKMTNGSLPVRNFFWFVGVSGAYSKFRHYQMEVKSRKRASALTFKSITVNYYPNITFRQSSTSSRNH